MEFNILKNTPLYNAFSELGKKIYLPEGIFYWSGRAKNEAELNGTIGVAYAYEKDYIEDGSSNWGPCYLENVRNFFQKENVNDIVTYASISGLSELRERWKKWIIRKSLYKETAEREKINKLGKFITNPLVTAGVTNAIFLNCALFLNPSDYIILPNKRWGNYDNIVSQFIGAKIHSYEFFNNGNFNVYGLIDAMKTVVKEQNKIVILLCFPNNPTGFIPTKLEVDEIIDNLKGFYEKFKCPVVVLIDDAYEPYVYSKNVSQRSIFYDLQQVDEDIIPVKLDGITKELLIYGGRVGFTTIGLKEKWIQKDQELESLKNELDNKLSAINRSTISNCNHYYQTVAMNLIEENNIANIINKRDKVVKILQKRYEVINTLLKNLNNPSARVDPNGGGFFVFLNLDPTLISANEFADHLLKKYKVGVIPMQSLKENINGIRIAYSSVSVDAIPKFIEAIDLALKDFK